MEWAVLPSQATRWWWQQRLSVVRGFARYLQAFDPDTEIPPPGLICSPAPRVTPYVFSGADITALMTAAGKLNPPLRAATYQTLIGLAAVTGMFSRGHRPRRRSGLRVCAAQRLMERG